MGAIEYLAWVGTTFGAELAESYQDRFSGRRLALKQGMAAIEAYELDINKALLEGLGSVPGLHIWGITDVKRMGERVPTFSFSLEGWHPGDVAEALDKEGIYVWDGNFYALAVLERLGLEEQGGIVRVGPTHYNTRGEIEKLVAALNKIKLA
ncbi:aminotransferase class V-fold PLP-dependent enzyme [Ktedonosporobacter rubrisoli]|uniref:aminotransferase class V-fold PLP-dependent enzyme n=1 Tax=Ktedonosporobacter rubrisoli TaxID=2509675 RepID=UPI001A92D091|nr:aminotransferase class V-fold PLP-dependent enzyme [Ktedonosporobacter rubrisoli]